MNPIYFFHICNIRPTYKDAQCSFKRAHEKNKNSIFAFESFVRIDLDITYNTYADLNNQNCFFFLFAGIILQPETIVLNVSGRILMVNRENNGNSSTEQLVSLIYFILYIQKMN